MSVPIPEAKQQQINNKKLFLPGLTRLKSKYNHPNQCRPFSAAHGCRGLPRSQQVGREGGRHGPPASSHRAGCPELPAGIPGDPRSMSPLGKERMTQVGTHNRHTIALGPYNVQTRVTIWAQRRGLQEAAGSLCSQGLW